MNYLENNIGGFHDLHSFGRKLDKITIPLKYHSIYEEFFNDIHDIPWSTYNIRKLIYIYNSIFWLDSWYNESIITTPFTTFYPTDGGDNVVFDSPKFVKLNSVSSKNMLKPVYSLKEARQHILQSNRCQNLMDTCKLYDLPVYIAIREWIDIDEGVEFRCFIYNDKLTAICSNDDKILDIDDGDLVTRINTLIDSVKFNLPFYDCIMDVFLSDEKDYIIEFNSYGPWANGSSGEFNWFTDEYDLQDSSHVTIKRNE